MTVQIGRIAIKVGCIDALIFFIIWSAISVLSTTHPNSSLLLIGFLIVPASILVGWRGAASVRHIWMGTSSLRHAIFEGFVSGASFFFLIWLYGIASSALAAGSATDGLSPLQFEFWYAIVVTLLSAITIGGVLGAIHGVMLVYLNRWLVKLLFLTDGS